jgi:hypothetical protein
MLQRLAETSSVNAPNAKSSSSAFVAIIYLSKLPSVCSNSLAFVESTIAF